MKLGNFPYAVLGLVAQRPDGVHGYQLKREFECLADDFWQLNYGRLYRVLDLLEQAGELAVTQQIQNGRPNRKVYRITEKGKQSLDDWLLQPASENPEPLRDELALKLLFFGRSRLGELSDHIRGQRGVYLTRLAHIERSRKRLEKSGFDMIVTGLILDQAEMRVHADLGWLDHVERKIIREF